MIIGMESGMGKPVPVQIVEPYTPYDFSAFLDLLDNLLDAVETRRLDDVSEMDRRQVVGWLKDIGVTTAEIIAALEQRH